MAKETLLDKKAQLSGYTHHSIVNDPSA